MNYLVLEKKQGPRDRAHLLQEHAQENPWKVLLVVYCCPLAYTRPRASFVQAMYDLVNSILQEAGANRAHDFYTNRYPAHNGRLRPHEDRKQVKFTSLLWS